MVRGHGRKLRLVSQSSLNIASRGPRSPVEKKRQPALRHAIHAQSQGALPEVDPPRSMDKCQATTKMAGREMSSKVSIVCEQ